MDFEDNNPLGMEDEERPRPRVHSRPSYSQQLGSSRIIISEAGKTREGTSRGHISYSIRKSSGNIVRRRYSDFESLRKLLRRMFPCIVLPSIPEKHSLGTYAANPAHAHEDTRIIEHRKRTLADFLNRCVAIPEISKSWVLERFLDPNTSWREILQSEEITKLPRSPLQAPPVDPASATLAHSYLPIPTGAASLVVDTVKKPPSTISKVRKRSSQTQQTATNSDDEDVERSDSETDLPSEWKTSASSESTARDYEHVIGNGLEKRARKVNKHYSALAVEYADLGGQLNSFSLDSHGQFEKFAPAVEKVGQAVDQGYISTNRLVDELAIQFSEPLAETTQMALTARQVLKYRRQRELQVQILEDSLKTQTAHLARLQSAETEVERMNSYLQADDRIQEATRGLDNVAKANTNSDGEQDRDHVVDQHGVHDHDHEITSEHYSENFIQGKVATSSSTKNNATSKNKQTHETQSSTPGDTGAGEVETLVPSTNPEPTRSWSGSRRGFKLPGLSHINYAIHGMMDVDPQTTRRNNILRTQERIQRLQAGLEVAKVDAGVATREVTAEISRYNTAKREDIRELVRAFVKCHIDWAEKNLESWVEAKQAIANS